MAAGARRHSVAGVHALIATYCLSDATSAFDRFVASELFGTLRSHASLRDVRASDYAISDGLAAVTRRFGRIPEAAS